VDEGTQKEDSDNQSSDNKSQDNKSNVSSEKDDTIVMISSDHSCTGAIK